MGSYMLSWAWPVKHNIQSLDWRQKLTDALARGFGLSSACVQYNTSPGGGLVASPGGLFQTEVTIDLPGDDTRTYTGSLCRTPSVAINCVSWVAMMHLCNEGILETPPEIIVPDTEIENNHDSPPAADLSSLAQLINELRMEVAAMNRTMKDLVAVGKLRGSL